MGGFLLGLIIGIVGTFLFVLYDEGDLFLKLSRQIKTVMARYKQQQG